jgi:colanic acid/amylovoran biosynthesis glycosyltransferase
LLGFQPYSVFFKEAYKHHIFISPSVTARDGDSEGGAPVSIIEMIASGIPVVSTSHCDIPEVLNYGMSDWLVKERDIQGLAEKIRWLSENREDWTNILVRGRNHLEAKFDASQQGNTLAEIYKNVLN